MRAVCGLDVHKDSVFLCILHDSGEIFEKVFGVLTHELRDMRRQMQSHGVTEVTMESTAVYWIPIWRVLEPYFHLKLVNPYFIKQLPGRKSDVYTKGTFVYWGWLARNLRHKKRPRDPGSI